MDLSPGLNELSLSSDVAKRNDNEVKVDEDALALYDPRHPERLVPYLIWGPSGKNPAGYDALRAEQGQPPTESFYLEHRGGKEYCLCWACGWTERHQIFSSYSPRVKIMHARENMGLWDIGGQWVLRDQPNDASAGNDLMTQRFLRAQSGHTIPLVSDIIELNRPSDTVQLTLMRRARGKPLDTLWPQLSAAQRKSYVHQMADIVRQMRQFTAPRAQKVDGTLLNDLIIGFCVDRRAPSCTKIGPTADAWLDALAPTLRGGLSRIHRTADPAIIEAKLLDLRAKFPSDHASGPSGGLYYLTHGDLNLTNIIVYNDKIEAIIDWEMAGYYPWWAERYINGFNNRPSEELLDPMWALLYPEQSLATMQRDAFYGVGAVIGAWGSCNVDHPGKDDIWLRPAFSTSEPSSGGVRMRFCGFQPEHQIRDVQYGAKNPTFPSNGAHACME